PNATLASQVHHRPALARLGAARLRMLSGAFAISPHPTAAPRRIRYRGSACERILVGGVLGMHVIRTVRRSADARIAVVSGRLRATRRRALRPLATLVIAGL